MAKSTLANAPEGGFRRLPGLSSVTMVTHTRGNFLFQYIPGAASVLHTSKSTSTIQIIYLLYST